jgi:heme A synthase
MAEVHRAFGQGVIVATVVFTLFAGALAFGSGSNRWLERSRLVLMAAIGVQLILGILTYATGARPDEPLHILYGVIMAGALPLASRFAEDAPPKPRGGVLAGAGIVMCLLLWRLVQTG